MIDGGTGERTLRLAGLANARDLGGLPRADGTLTPRGVFVRADNVDRMTPSGWEDAYAAGVRTVVDLRQPVERARDTAERPGWLTTVAVDLDGLDNREFWKDYWDNGLCGTPLYYLPHLRAMPERAVDALTAIVSAPAGGVLFHCMSGRDRTGVVAMLLLAAAGVAPDAIVEDYLESTRRRRAEGIIDAGIEGETLCRSRGTTTEGAFRSALAGLDLDALLTAGGMRQDHRAALLSWRGSLRP